MPRSGSNPADTVMLRYGPGDSDCSAPGSCTATWQYFHYRPSSCSAILGETSPAANSCWSSNAPARNPAPRSCLLVWATPRSFRCTTVLAAERKDLPPDHAPRRQPGPLRRSSDPGCDLSRRGVSCVTQPVDRDLIPGRRPRCRRTGSGIGAEIQKSHDLIVGIQAKRRFFDAGVAKSGVPVFHIAP